MPRSPTDTIRGRSVSCSLDNDSKNRQRTCRAELPTQTGFLSAFTNFRTGRSCENENALLAVILADATNLGLARMAEASHGVTRDQLVWTKDLTPLIWEHVNPYGRYELDMRTRIAALT